MQGRQNVKARQTTPHKKDNVDPRPALTLLNQLNCKLIQEDATIKLQQQLKESQKQNKRLKQVNKDLNHQLNVQKKLRKEWTKIEEPLYIDLEQVQDRLSQLKIKYGV